MKKPKCGECCDKSEAVSSMFPFCSECEYVAATPKQYQRHVLEHERVWWRSATESWHEVQEESEWGTFPTIYIPDFEEYLKIIGLCRCSFPQQSECDVINTEFVLEFVTGLFPGDKTSAKTLTPLPDINNTQVSLQSPFDNISDQRCVSKVPSSSMFNPGCPTNNVKLADLPHNQ